jgi:hypothetical protein
MRYLALLLTLAVGLMSMPAAAQVRDRMADDVETALVAWTTPRTPEGPEEAAHRVAALRPWADAMANVCTDRSDCILLAAQAFVETRFVSWAVDQSCNDASWRATRRGWERASCDGGVAWGPWQVHDERFRGASPAFQASVVHALMHSRPQAWTTWRLARSHAAWWEALAPEIASR